MARVKGGFVRMRRRKRILKLAKGYYGSKHRLFKSAKEQVMKSLLYAYRDRRQRKRDFRKLWITRINAAAASERPELQQVHARSETGRRGSEPQDARGPRGERFERVQRAGRHCEREINA